MLLQLYQNFQKWSSTGSIWIYSDTHFEDDDCKLMDSNWITPQEQIDIINSKATKKDTLILLGDIGNLDWIRKLKAGYKILIAGNHDKGLTNYEKKEIKKIYDAKTYNYNKKLLRQELLKEFPNHNISIQEIYDVCHAPFVRLSATIDNCLFDEVYGGPLFIGEKILLSHEPIDIPFALNIHGHDHGAEGGYYDDFHYNVCSNCIKYTPINLKDIISTGILSKIDNIHRITIDKAIENK